MFRLRFRQYKNAAETVAKATPDRSIFTGRRIQHRWCFGLAVAASVLALLAISLGFATFGISVYVAAILPFAFFS
ncbi:conserved exported hypothetical protein [Paraburkholderia piptadeniae]|uniref:Uncharacterized protein n=1 Tax=Paraburkholderia piptadeniae TaxID=1701573 RepID=A0A1N7S3A7_9BURK|nr:conserved exported hypothetical protein [Paraburkholderia piptadeniae]